jgi:hypothetical protein
MRANGAVWLKRIALAFVFAVSTGSSVWAQTPVPDDETLTTLTPGVTAWIKDTTGREEKRQILGVSDGIVTAAAGENVRRRSPAEIVRVRVRHSDSVINGALIGAGVSLASGLFLCRAMEPWEVCNDVGPLFRIGALGAGIGIAVDALIRGRKTIYEAPHGALRLQASPMIGRRAAGLQFSVSF